MSILSRLVKKHKHERESFDARLQMEKMAQDRVSERLRILEIQVKNEARLK